MTPGQLNRRNRRLKDLLGADPDEIRVYFAAMLLAHPGGLGMIARTGQDNLDRLTSHLLDGVATTAADLAEMCSEALFEEKERRAASRT